MSQLKQKYPISRWILSRENVSLGDTVSYYSQEEGREIIAEVTGFPSHQFRQYITCLRDKGNVTEVINFYNTVVYNITNLTNNSESVTPIVESKSCTCGAKFTSNPNFHLGYCDLG